VSRRVIVFLGPADCNATLRSSVEESAEMAETLFGLRNLGIREFYGVSLSLILLPKGEECGAAILNSLEKKVYAYFYIRFFSPKGEVFAMKEMESLKGKRD
jgi:hypothetical protein